MKTFHSVKREIFIKANPERIWKALTDERERNKWETTSCEIHLQVGGKIELDYGWGVTFSGTIIEIEELKKLVIQDQDKELTIWSIIPEESGSLVTIEYTGLWSGNLGIMEMENMCFGTYQFMRNLKSVLEVNDDIRHSFWLSWIGVNHKTTSSIETPGTEVVSIIPNTPAFGLLHIGDIITYVNGISIDGYEPFERFITETIPNQRVTLEINRSGQQIKVELNTVPYGSKITPSTAG
ncbi:SRPBCC domain-containing protein [Bacillus sp. CGMCC 1.16607]|uniref:SRPBCC domain-containing protein n=1 Tax=Bacillus sp. CGMCC 1.16607 TaxID=3351842 RepID=UPI003628DB63